MALRFSPIRGAASLVLNALVRGPQGTAATIAVGTTTTLAPGATPTVANGGTVNDAVLNFGLPATPTIAVGTATTKAAGTSATVNNSGSSTTQIYDFGIPRGADGGLRFSFDASTTMAAPSSGAVRFNNAIPASITQVAISATDADSNTVRPYMLTWDDSTNPAKGAIIFKKEATGTAIVLLINGTITDNTTWLQIPVTWSSGLTLFSAADPVYAKPDITGNKGNDGNVAGPGVSVDSEIALWSGTGGATLKRATGSGLAKLTSGVLGVASAGTDYAAATSGAAILKGNGAGGFSAAVAGTDYYNPGGTDVALADGGTGASTAAAALANLTARGQGKETIWIPAAAMTPRITNGPSSGTVEMSTNKNMFKTLDFAKATQQFAQFEVFFPKSWNLGTVTFQPMWSHAATTTNFGVTWGLAGVARSRNDAGDVAFGTVVTSVDTGGTTNNIYLASESGAITIAGTPTLGDTVQFQLNRTVADAGDTMAINARLHGIRLFFTTNAATDA
jgi:hypothetical protein